MNGSYRIDAVEEIKSNTLLQILKLLGTLLIASLIVGLIFTYLFPSNDMEGPWVFGPKADIAWVCISLIFAFVSNLVVEYNSAQRLINVAKRYKSEIQIAEETSDLLISKAEKVADKYRNTEESVYNKFAESRQGASKIKNSTDFKAVMEAYPELKANIHTQKLLSQIEITEQQRANAKKLYAEYTARYNGKIHSFPISVFRRMLKLEEITAYELLRKEDIVSDEELGI